MFKDGENDYAPGNYQNEYDGPITLRRALALSRNIVAIKVAEATGYDRVADALEEASASARRRKPYPSIALGVFEASPLDMATAYTVFANGGAVRPLQAITTHRRERQGARRSPPAEPRPVARADTTYLVTNMMRSVINEGTGAGARAAGFTLDAAGKTGTTNDLRDAWFVGFTPELLTVVWVGLRRQPADRPERLAGRAADLDQLHEARAGRRARASRSTTPDGIVFADDRQGHRQARDARSARRTITEAFLAGTEPHGLLRRARRHASSAASATSSAHRR